MNRIMQIKNCFGRRSYDAKEVKEAQEHDNISYTVVWK